MTTGCPFKAYLAHFRNDFLSGLADSCGEARGNDTGSKQRATGWWTIQSLGGGELGFRDLSMLSSRAA
jgi:hypothetical protein